MDRMATLLHEESQSGDKGLCVDFVLWLQMQRASRIARSRDEWMQRIEACGGNVLMRWRDHTALHVPLGTTVDRVAIVNFECSDNHDTLRIASVELVRNTASQPGQRRNARLT